MQENIASVIMGDTSNTCFVWKHPEEDFYTGSQLIVHESQEAVFCMNGQALDSFGPGRHTLTTQNMPIDSGIFRRVTGDKTPFHCEVYFVNKTEQLAIKWGTSSKMEYMEPTYGFPIQLGASGEMSLQVSDARQLLNKVIGTEKGISQEELVSKFRAFLLMRVKNYIVALITQEKINVFEIDNYLERISEALLEKLKEDFAEYGMALKKFLVTTIAKPEDNKDYKRFKELFYRQHNDIFEARLQQQVGLIEQQTKAQQMVIEAEGIAKKRSLEGYTYQEERRFDVAENFASNEATGQMANVGIGLGMISGIGGAVGNGIGNIVGGALGQTSAGFTAGAGATNANAAGVSGEAKIKCEGCGAEIAANAKFCPECGAKNQPKAAETIVCPGCGMTVAKKKFCAECGHLLEEPVCPDCGAKVAANAKFCAECGRKMN